MISPGPQLRLFLSNLGVLTLLALVAGCSNDPHPTPLEKTRPDGSPWIVRYWYLPDEVRSLDPQVSYDQVSHYITEPIYDAMMQYKPMKTDPYEVEPCLLEATPEPKRNEDGSVTYLCRLKQGVYFHDDPCFQGKKRELVASDIAYVFQRLSDPKLESPIFSNLTDYVAGMAEAYAEAEKAGRFDYDHLQVKGVELIDKYSFNLHLLKPYPQIVYWLAMPFTAPVAREAVEYYDGKEHPDGQNGKMVTRPVFKFHPVGTGAFMIHDWVRNQRIRLVRNPDYHTVTFPTGGWPAEREATNRQFAGKQLPLVDEVQITVFKEILPIWLLMRQGYLDRMGVLKDAVNSAISSSSELAPQWSARGMKLHKALEVSTFYMVFNMQDPLLGKNKKLRQALSCAYDAHGYSELAYGGVAPVAQQLLPPGIFGYDKDFRNSYGTNLEKGKKLLVEAGYPNGIDPATNAPLEISMDVVATGSEERQLAEYEQRQLEQLGIRIRVVENTFARILEKEDQGNFQIAAGSGWGADYPDAENFFFLFSSANFPPQGKNIGRYKNEEFDKLFNQMSTMENTPERLELIRKMNDIMIEDCPILLSFNKGYYVISQPWAPLTHMNLIMDGGLKYLPVDPALQQQKRREWNPKPMWPVVMSLMLVFAIGAYAVWYNKRQII